MAQEISKPATLRRWVARSLDGSVVHVGETAPRQVTTTGQPVLEEFDDVVSRLVALSLFSDRFPPLPPEGEPLVEGQLYSHLGEVVEVRRSHIRTSRSPDDESERFLTPRSLVEVGSGTGRGRRRSG